MKEHINKISQTALFHGIKADDLMPMLTCLGSYIRNYKKGEFVFLSNDSIHSIGVILEGTIHMIKEDIWGNKTILTFIKNGELFGETFACGSQLNSVVSFYAATNCKILFMPFHKILHSCNMSCIFHHRLIENMVQLIADKNTQLMEKIEITSKKSLREKILTYMSIQAQFHQSNYFEIPLGRLELADYLCANRSALTRELNNMKQEGILDFEKNRFHLLKKN
ncbi:Crp/Fnr family transcriptional regulator [Aminipila terrae]|uniref:Cyclic nucleotide-binding domain-containing protein n=1 Tax=Aminipila terrae TaxID=2697030 RepID=A0A6P1MFM0_9FIRM|nr:Crp/Fnr family transcriptional regulator [Aminipila terrae]QHI73509.1 cyclic nucleotide-binding domain-containing protein [Aminipila terrae]